MYRRLLALTLILSCFLVNVPAVPAQVTADLEFLDGLKLVELDSDDAASLHAARSSIAAAGGRVAIMALPNVLLGWIPEAAEPDLLGRSHIRAIHSRPVSMQKTASINGDSRYFWNYFNSVKTGAYQERVRSLRAAAKPSPKRGDAFPAQPIDGLDYLRNLQENGFDLNQLRDRGLLVGKSGADGARIQGTSDRMTGTVTVSLLFVESDGTGADPDTYTWTEDHMQDYLDGTNTGLAWWTQQAQNYNDCWVAFFVRPVWATDLRNHQWREMVLHSSSDVAGMASDIMANYGFGAGSHFTRVESFNSAQCATYGTDWAYTAFIAYNPPPAPTALTNGTSAFAYLFGPYTFLLYRSFGWQPNEVLTHETGHIFGACDEYAEGCTCGVLCAGESNQNCEECPGSVSCMMKQNSFTLCSYTDEQLGWHDFSPCAPPTLTPPTISTLGPDSGQQGTSMTLTVTGSDFLFGAFANLGSGVTIESTTWLNSTTLELEISIGQTATPGPRTLTVSNRDLQNDSEIDIFTVAASTKHYYAAGGGNVFPYITAADAATTLSDAIAAAGAGDSILVESGTINLTGLTIDRGVILYGAWISNFSSRDVVNSKTVLNLNGNVAILAASGTAGLDGFLLQNGRGSFGANPVNGDYGGAVNISSSSASIANCEIANNVGTLGSGFSAGGAIFAINSTLDLANNDIHDNTATHGAAIYLSNVSGTFTDNLISDNDLVTTSGFDNFGAGMYITGCTNLVLSGNALSANTGAVEGGGLWIDNSTGLQISGGSLQSHSVTDHGAAIYLGNGSELTVDAVSFTGNSASFFAGSIYSTNSTLTAQDNQISANTALLYPGIYATGGAANILHNLIVNNITTGAGGAIGAFNLSSGEISGNTIDGNAAGIGIGSSGIEVSNNIVVNSSGDGINCSGSPAPTLLHNLVWNNTTDYAGCTPDGASLSEDPLFVDSGNDDYHLALHSPAIDAGRTDPGYEDPDASPGDMGWFGSHSFTMDQPAFPQNLVAGSAGADIVLNWDANGEADLASYAVYGDVSSGFKPSATNFLQSVAAPTTSVNLGDAGGATFFVISAVDNDGYASGYSNEVEADSATDAPEPRYALRLLQNVPNPFNPMTTIAYELHRSGPVRLDVFDLAGRLVATLASGSRQAGRYEAVWDGRHHTGQRVASGVYLYKLRFDGRVLTNKLVILK